MNWTGDAEEEESSLSGMDWFPHPMRPTTMTLDQSNTYALLDLIEKTGYNIIQENGQRRFGPPPDWIGPPPPRGCEVFVAKIPRDAYEDELVPVFGSIGQIYKLRLMLEFSGENRGYAFVTYTNRKDSKAAVDLLNHHELRPGRPLVVCISNDNCRLFIGGLPRDKSQEEILEELKKVTSGIKDAIVSPAVGMAPANRNRGFAYVQYDSHRSAFLARRKLLPGSFHLWGCPIQVDWAIPESEVNPVVSDGRTLNVKNLSPATSEQGLRSALQRALYNGAGGDHAHAGAIDKITKIGNLAVVDFKRREDALRAQNSLHRSWLDGVQVDVSLARPAFSQHAADGGEVMNDHDAHREPEEPQTHSRMVDHVMPRPFMNQSLARLDSASGALGVTRRLAAYLGEAFWRDPNAEETSMSHQEIDLAGAHTATVRLELWCAHHGFPPPLYSPFCSTGSAGQQLYGYTVYMNGVPGGIFDPNEVCSVLDGAKELAAQNVLNKLGINNQQNMISATAPAYQTISTYSSASIQGYPCRPFAVAIPVAFNRPCFSVPSQGIIMPQWCMPGQLAYSFPCTCTFPRSN